MTLVTTYLSLALGIAFVCSLVEAALLSTTQVYIELSCKEGKRTGFILQRLKKDIDRSFSAILTLSTTANTFFAAAIGAEIQNLYGQEMVTVASVLLTLAILFFAEILPKILGTVHWKALAPVTAYVVQFMVFVLFPIVWVTEIFSNRIARPISKKFSREEVIMTAEMGANEGSIHKKESTIIKNLLMLNNMYVLDIMTPRTVMFALEASMTVSEVAQIHKPIRYSRIPVYNDSLDTIIGMTHRYRILEALSNDQHNLRISEITVPIATISEQTTVALLLDEFIKKKEHLALAADEYGVITGLVSLEDAIETLLGVEIVDEFDSVADLRQFALEQWQNRKAQVRLQK